MQVRDKWGGEEDDIQADDSNDYMYDMCALCVPVIRCEIIRWSWRRDILGHSPGPEMQQTIQNKSDENACNLRALGAWEQKLNCKLKWNKKVCGVRSREQESLAVRLRRRQTVFRGVLEVFSPPAEFNERPHVLDILIYNVWTCNSHQVVRVPRSLVYTSKKRKTLNGRLFVSLLFA